MPLVETSRAASVVSFMFFLLSKNIADVARRVPTALPNVTFYTRVHTPCLWYATPVGGGGGASRTIAT